MWGKAESPGHSLSTPAWPQKSEPGTSPYMEIKSPHSLGKPISSLGNILPCSGLGVCFFVLLNRLASPTVPAVPSEEGWSLSPAAVEGWVQTISHWSWGPMLITEAGLTLSLLYIPSRACVSCVSW